MQTCILCNEDGGEIILSNELFRVVYVSDANYPGFVRLIVNKHVKEQSDLTENDSFKVFKALITIEKTLGQIYTPDKINLASLGNIVPHLHWHIIPRYKNDKHFPNPIWGEVTNPNYMPHAILSLKDQLLTNLQELFKSK